MLPKSLIDWKRQFIVNMSLAFDKSAVVSEYKEQIDKLEKQSDELAKKVGTLTIERDWLAGKLRSLDLSTRRKMVDSEGVQAITNTKTPSQHTPMDKRVLSNLSLNRQLELLSLSKTAYYYKPVAPFSSHEDKELLDMIDKIHAKRPYYGTRRMEKLLKRVV